MRLLKHYLMAAACLVAMPHVVAQTQAPAAATAASAPAAQSKIGQSDATTDAIKKLFSERFGNMPVQEVRYAPFGLFEVQIGNSLVYTDQAVNFVLDGHLIDATSRQDLTEQRLQELARIDFDALPKELAITQVRGDGSRKMALFEDPNCGYCKQLRRSMEGIDNLTVYTYMLPILSEDSTEKVKNVWCSDNPSATWDAWMLQGKVPAQKTCEAPLDDLVQLGRDLQVQGTPAIFFADGSRVPGAISKAELEKRLK
ncbi:DsbC family protein [Orrella daihaiensis]|uniref:Thiol:disulfide interchange protein n=1 Tax=Orrella daihaiensis TaxID=2782176 RepID=A0ABY4AJE1_9BURK|nr:DsbC family protein [Orrella daihaiensis]UOD50304.1 DsbC family protein [Orrella daihaiensis]